MKFIVFVALNIISGTLFVLFHKQKSKIAFYYAGYISAFSLGLLAITLDPDPEHYIMPFALPHLLARICSVVSYRMSPFFLLNASISVVGIYSNNPKKRTLLSLITFLPVFIGFVIDGMNPRQSFIFSYPDYLPNFWWMFSSWGLFYTLLSNILLYYAVIIENVPQVKRQKMIIAFLALPTLFIAWNVYISPVLGKHDFSNLNATFGVFIFITIIIAVARTGFIGLKLSFEHDYMDRSIKTLYSGASLINHAVRNELQLINIAAETIKTNSPESMKYIRVIENASHHLEDLVRRFSEKTKPITLYIEEIDINQLVDEILSSMEKMFIQKSINVTKQCLENSPTVKCDRVHVEEVLLNVLYNSIEAMPQGGSITLAIYIKGRTMNIDVTDSGIGMSKYDMKHILEPFYSTKKDEKNLGLGLTYCFAVMKQHHGSLHITSGEDSGTTVTLSLPKR